MTLGLVCDRCDALSPVNAAACVRCGAGLAADAVDETDLAATPAVAQVYEIEAAPEEPFLPGPGSGSGYEPELAATIMDPLVPLPSPSPLETFHDEPTGAVRGSRQCPYCSAPTPANHKFCGECGQRLDVSAAAAAPRRTQYQRALLEETGHARLVLIKGDGHDTIAYHLAGTEHVVGRTDGEILFAEDPLVSPRHANFYYRGHDLYVRDEGSRNGVFVRIRAPVRIDAGQPFLVGEQLLAVQPASVEGLSAADTEGTYYYGSPRRPARVRLIQILAGGDLGMAQRVSGELLSIGREGNSVNFPEDPFISGHHAHVVSLDDGAFRLSDVGSKNGTFVRITGDQRLDHGDFVFLGQQLLRVEFT